MESSSSHALLGDLRVCGTGCGLADEKSRAVDAQARAASSKKLCMAIVLCGIFIAVELAGGLVANSLAILTDAAHLLSDVAGFAISLFAIWASSWEATPRQSYGFFRLEILGALLSIQLIWLLTGIIVYEAIYRITHTGEPINGRLMFLVATFGFCVNLIMVFLLGHHGHDYGHRHGHDHAHTHGHGHDHGHAYRHAHNHNQDHTHVHGNRQDHALAHGNEHDHAHVHGDGHGHGHEHKSQETQSSLSNDSYGDDYNADHSHDSHDGQKEDHDDQESHQSSGLLEEFKRTHNIERSDSFSVDIDMSKIKKSSAGNINIKGAWLHVLGDLIQSIGVMVGGAIIWVKPEWRVVDLICTLLFSVLVLATTIRILRDTMEVLMESTPREIDAKKLEKGLCAIRGVVAIHELHIWAITLGKTLLACHVTIMADADADDILQKVIGYCDRVFSISHVTIQIERHRGDLALDSSNC